MPRHLKPKKDAVICEKPWLEDNTPSQGYPNGETYLEQSRYAYMNK